MNRREVWWWRRRWGIRPPNGGPSQGPNPPNPLLLLIFFPFWPLWVVQPPPKAISKDPKKNIYYIILLFLFLFIFKTLNNKILIFSK
jgi:hypothetical protein